MVKTDRSAGVSMVEMLVVVTISSILATLTFARVLQTVETFRLSSTASSVANLISRARSEAVRLNTATYLRAAQTGNLYAFYIDVDRDGVISTGDPELVLATDVSIISESSAPADSSMGLGSTTAFPQLSATPALNSIKFNSRGVVEFTGSPTIYTLHLGSSNGARYGYRALSISSSGKVKVWMVQNGGSWNSQ